MKMRLRVVETTTMMAARASGQSVRKHSTLKTCNVPQDSSVVGTEIDIRGTSYFVIDQYPAKKAQNAAKKAMTARRFQKWAMGLR